MLLLSLLMVFSGKAFAWDNHQVILEQMLDTKAAKRRIYPYRKISVPCPNEEKKEIEIVAKDLQINAAKIPVFSAKLCKPGETSTEMLVSDLLTSSIVDEPDQGMDQNLPESADPHHFRKWMGGETGPTSQGFRHMFFPGFELFSPIRTLQIPTGRVGEALERIKMLRSEADSYFAKGNKFWGTRILLWEVHYIQDLHQPFHVMQVPSIHFLSFGKFFSGFVASATHSIGNYHYAYEGLALEWMKSSPTTDFKDCFETSSADAPTASFTEAFEILKLPRSVGNEVGLEVYTLFGDPLKSEEVDLPNGVGPIDYFAMSKLSDPPVLPDDELKLLSKDEVASYNRHGVQYKSLVNLKRITCDLVRSAAQMTWNEFDRSYIKLVAPSDSMNIRTAK